MGVRIITDSAADLPKDVVKQYGISVLPLRVYLGDQEFLDNVTLNPNDLFAGMREGKTYKTSQPAFQDIMNLFQEYAENKESCLYLAFSSELSGTYQTAVMVQRELQEQYPDFDLDILDTKCASYGQGMVVIEAARMAQEGKSKAEILQSAAFRAEHMEHIFTVDNLEYLLRGGRVSPLAAFIGGILNIKPILNVDDGKLIPFDKVRGRKKAFQRIIEVMNERGHDLRGQTIGISHGDDPEAVAQITEMIQERFGCKAVSVSMIGAAVGAHAGPGTIAIFFMNAEEPGAGA